MNIKYKLHLTDNYINTSKDEIISNLRLIVGEHESYIDEIEDENSKLHEQIEEYKNTIDSLREELEKTKNAYKIILDRYSQGINTYVSSDEYCKKFKEKIEELTKERDLYREHRDKLIRLLSQYV